MAIYHGKTNQEDYSDEKFEPVLLNCPEEIKKLRYNGLSEPCIRKLIRGEHLGKVLEESDLRIESFHKDQIAIYLETLGFARTSTPIPDNLLDLNSNQDRQLNNHVSIQQTYHEKRNSVPLAVTWTSVHHKFDEKVETLHQWLCDLQNRVIVFNLSNEDAVRVLMAQIGADLFARVLEFFRVKDPNGLKFSEICIYLRENHICDADILKAARVRFKSEISHEAFKAS